MSKEDIEILEKLLEEGFEAMCPDEAQALENILEDYKQKLNALDIEEKFIKQLGDEMEHLQKENEANKKRIEELEEENKMFKEFYRACGSTDIAENITATRYVEIRRQGYMEGVAERDKLAKEICKECCEKNKKDSIPKAKVEEILEKEELPNVIVGGRRNSKTLNYGKKLGRIELCKELLKGGGE